MKVNIAGFDEGDGDIIFKLCYGYGPLDENGYPVYEAYYTNGLNFGALKEQPMGELNPLIVEPIAYGVFDFAGWQNRIPTDLANYDALTGLLG